MNVSVLSDGAVAPVLAFAFSLVGCLLAMYSLARAAKAADWRRRSGWLLLGVWALVATAVWDGFFVAAVGLQSEGLQVRYHIASIIMSIVVSVAVSTAVLLLLSFRSNLAGSLIGGAFVGAVMAVDSFQVLHALRVNATVTFRAGILVAVAVAVGALVTTPAAFWIAFRSRRRGALNGAAVLLAAIVTGIHYLGLSAVEISQPVAQAVTAGLLPIAVMVPIVMILIVRFVLLLLVLLSES